MADNRVKITLRCEECKQRNYNTIKNKKKSKKKKSKKKKLKKKKPKKKKLQRQ